MSVSFKHGKMTVLALLILGMILGGLFVSNLNFISNSRDMSYVPTVNADARTLKEFSDTFANVAEQVKPAVVLIQSKKMISPQQSNDPFFDDLFGPFLRSPQQPSPQPQRGLGSGVIVSKDGYILTNNHVIDDADEITVLFPDKKKLKAKLIGSDARTDLAVIKVDSDNLSVLPFGDSDHLRVGEWVLAVGNPFGLEHTVTAGIVSAKGRHEVLSGESYEDFIQTDAAINPGNSGGALVDLDGNLMGINTAIVSRDGGYQGIGFAIPANMARDVMITLIKEGKITRGYLGIYIRNLDEEMADALGLDSQKGAYVTTIQEDGPAAKSDLKQDDVIVAINGKEIEDSDQFRKAVAAMPPGTKVKLDVIREGKRRTAMVELGELPAMGRMADADKPQEKSAASRLGFDVQDVTPEIGRRFGYDQNEGVIIAQVEPGGVADDAGLSRGDLIKEVNRRTISSVREFVSIIRGYKPGDALMFRVRRGNQEFVLGLRVPSE